MCVAGRVTTLRSVFPFLYGTYNPDTILRSLSPGISKTGEMGRLEELIKPRFGLITNIGEAHSEGFDSREQKLREKLGLFKDCEKLFYCSDDPLIRAAVDELPKKIKRSSWSRKNKADLTVKKVASEGGHSRIEATYKKEAIALSIPFTDEASVENALHCMLVSLSLGIDPSKLET